MEGSWEHHKETIRQLYLIDQLPISTVALQLKEVHGFDRKVHQYHHKLKSWGFRKNLKQAEREGLYQNLNKRKADAPEVFLNGVVLGEKRIKRLMSRVSVSSEWTRPGSKIDTNHVSHAAQLFLSIVSSEKPQMSRLSWFGTLPWLDFSKTYLPVPLHDDMSSIYTQLQRTNILTRVKSLSIADLQSLIPEEHDGDHDKVISKLSRGNTADVEQEAFKVVLYKLSNKMLINHDIHPRLSDAAVLKMIKSVLNNNPEWLKSVLDSRSSTAIAITERLFAAAVRQAEFIMACQLLKTGLICPNGQIFAVPRFPTYRFMRGTSVVELSFSPETFFCTPLQMAASTGSMALTKALLRAGADVNPADHCTDLSALELACSLKPASLALDLVERLLHNGATVNRSLLATRPTALMIAVAAGNVALITMLLKHGADTERTYLSENSAGLELELTAMRLAVLQRSAEVFEALVAGSIVCSQSATSDHDLRVLAISATNQHVLEHLTGAAFNAECSWGEHPLTTRIFMKEITSRLTDMEDIISQLPDMEEYEWRSDRPGPMHAAAFCGKPELVSLLHSKGFSVNTKLTYESQKDISTINAIYLTYTYDVFVEWENLRTPLQVALYKRHVNTALRILDLGANEFDGSEVVLAARIESPDFIRALVGHGASVNEVGATPFATGLEYRNIETALELLTMGASIGDGDLTRAISCKDRGLIDLVWHLSTPNKRQSQGPNLIRPLEAACATGNRELFLWILSESWARYDSAALLASVWYAFLPHRNAFDVEEYTENVVKRLMRRHKRGRPMDSMEATALAIAIKCRYEYKGVLETLLAYLRPSLALAFDFKCEGSDFWWRNSTVRLGKSPIHMAVHKHSLQEVTLLLDKGFEPDEECLLETLQPGRPPVGMKHATWNTIAAAIWLRKHPSTWSESLVAKAFERVLQSREKARIDKLLDLKLRVNSRRDPDSGWTPLQLAALYSDNALVHRLIKAGADVNAHAAPQAGATALQMAAKSNKLDIVRTLLEHGANINAARARSRGRTALEGAAEYGRLDMVQLLLNKGAETDGEHRLQYLRAIRFAERYGHFGVTVLLKQHRCWTVQDAELMDSEHLMNEERSD
ncbi:ankyrin repeat-containing domain protein [Astrocystis sublimbata]|nr:ankyrin repeat-containing domain protein [Astrocystis sublimbata]